MRAIAVVILALGVAGVGFSQGRGISSVPLDKWGVDYLTKTWGLRAKSVSQSGAVYALVLEFTKDLNADELQGVRHAFREVGKDEKAVAERTVAAYFFDREMVVVKREWCIATTEITGVKGDAFRVKIVQTVSPGPSQVVKVEIRQVNKGRGGPDTKKKDEKKSDKK